MPYVLLDGIEIVWPHVECLDVVSRGVTFRRPTSHLGKPVTITTPAEIGALALAHLQAMTQKADSFG